MQHMKMISELDASRLSEVRILLTDIDDTITTDGILTAEAFASLEALQRSGLAIVPVTGRPAGWCDHIARMWPVDGIIGENGAFYFSYDRTARKMRQQFWTAPAHIASNRARLDALAKVILEAVPGTALASDQPYRIADLAIDFCEDVPALPDSAIEKIVHLFEQQGAIAKVSSIHVNGWFGDYDKLTMAHRLLESEFGMDQATLATSVIFAGDSPNDEPMFNAFEISVGVANVRDMSHRIKTLPTYITTGHSGTGFVELARHILAHRQVGSDISKGT